MATAFTPGPKMADDRLASTAARLDRYRWLLLRERHGWIGSAIRFARDALSDWWFGTRARRCLAQERQVSSCDFLLLQSAPKVIAFKRKQGFISALLERGHSLIEVALPSQASILASRQLLHPVGEVPTRYYGYAAHAQWVVARYQPKILLNDRNGSLYSPFLRLALNREGRLLVHLAHASTVEGSRRLGMIDYDYYFVFGQSSLEALQARRLRFGSTQVVLAGSHMIDRTYELPPVATDGHRVLLLGVGPDKEREPQYLETYRLVHQWISDAEAYRLLVKLHPRSRGEFWTQAVQSCERVELLPRETSLAQALVGVDLVFSVMSNAVIEAALAGRPVVPVYCGSERDIFDQERYFGPAVKDAAELSRRVSELDAAVAVDQSHAFAHHHLAEGTRGLENNIKQLERLLRHEPVASTRLSEALPVDGKAGSEHD